MNATLFISHYLVWHYTRGYRDMTATWLNFMWFVTHFFSLPLLLRTLFSPWKRMSVGHRKFDLEDWAEAVTFNILSRITGFIIRSVLIVLGVLILLVLCLGYVAFIILWCILPFFSLYVTYIGLSLLFV